MNSLKRLISKITFIAIFTCCSNLEIKHPTIIDLSNIDKVNKQSLNTAIDSIHFTILETNEESLIKNIGTIKIYKDKLFLKDDSKENIIIFDALNGNYINTFDKQGNGPGEYINIHDYIIKDDTLFLLDTNLQKIFIYDDNYNFINHIMIPFKAKGFIIDEENIILHKGLVGNNSENFQIFILDKKGAFINSFIKTNESRSIHFSAKNPLQISNDNVYFMPIYDNNIYNIRDKDIRKFISLEFGDKWIDEDILKTDFKNTVDFITALQKMKGVKFLNYTFGNDKIVFTFNIENQNYLVLYSIPDNIITSFDIIDDSFCQAIDIFGYYDNYFICGFDAYKLSDLLQKSSIIISEKEKFKSIDEFSNPILTFIKFK